MTPSDLFTAAAFERIRDTPSFAVDEHRITQLMARSAAMALTVERLTNRGLWILSRADSTYPELLRKRLGKQAPAILYGAGNPALLNVGGITIVGSRELHDDDIATTHAIAMQCAQQQINVISGGAKGADNEAMITTFDTGGTTVGVLADSLEKASVSGKYRSALMSGRITLITAYEPHVGFSVGNAMGRNKYMYAMSDFAVVIRSSTDGGTWNGACENLKHNWVPTFVCMSPTPVLGNQRLIERGAIPLDTRLSNPDFNIRQWIDTTIQHLPMDTIKSDNPTGQISMILE
jgi:predicted Rossmann fold nucleotide-binding protein DprA/Smf involved in DNA uptake